jgi:hypothetical protein
MLLAKCYTTREGVGKESLGLSPEWKLETLVLHTDFLHSRDCQSPLELPNKIGVLGSRPLASLLSSFLGQASPTSPASYISSRPPSAGGEEKAFSWTNAHKK